MPIVASTHISASDNFQLGDSALDKHVLHGHLSGSYNSTGSFGRLNVVGSAEIAGPIYVIDNKQIYFGTGDDFSLYHNGSHSYLNNTVGNIYYRNDVAGASHVFMTQYNGGSLTSVFEVTDAGATLLQGNLTVGGDIIIDDGGSLKEAGGTTAFTFDASGHVTKIGQDAPSSGQFLKWDGSKAVWDATSGGGASFSDGTATTISGSSTSTGSFGIAEIGGGVIDLKNQGAQSIVRFYCEGANAHYAEIKAPAHSEFEGDVTLTLPATTGTLALVQAKDWYTGTNFITSSFTPSLSPNVQVTGSMVVSGSVGNSTASLAVYGSGSEIFKVEGTNGTLFSVTDTMSGSIFSANLVSGLPVIEAFSDNKVTIGQYADPLEVYTSGASRTIISGSQYSTASFGHYANISASVAAAGFGSGGGGGSSAADDITAGDAAVTLTTTVGNITIDAQGDDTDIIFKGTDGTVDTEFMRIDGSTSKIGIGTATPEAVLHIEGDSNPQLLIKESSTEFVRIGMEGTNNHMCLGWDDSDDMLFGGFSSTTDTSISEYMRIEAPSGYVGIGTTSPDELLDVDGNIYASGNVSGSSTSTGSFAKVVVLDNMSIGPTESSGEITLNGSSGAISAVTVGGLLTQGSQDNITSVGILSAVVTSGNITSTRVQGTISGSSTSTGSFGHLMVGGANFTSASLAHPAGGGGGGQNNEYSFKTISVTPGEESDIVADTTTDTLTLAAGSNMTITTNAGTDTITFASTGGGGSDTDWYSGTNFITSSFTPSLSPNVQVTGSMIVSGSVGNLTASLAVYGSGSEIFKVEGTNGTLFSVTDVMSGSIFSANLVSGLPVIEAFSDNKVTFGQYADPLEVYTNGYSKTVLSGSSTSTASFGHYANISASVAAAGFGSGGGGGGGTITALNNATANELVTVGATTTELDAESNLTFDGSTLTVTGDVNVTGDITIDDGGSLKEAGGIAAFTFDASGNVTKIGQDVPSDQDLLMWNATSGLWEAGSAGAASSPFTSGGITGSWKNTNLHSGSTDTHSFIGSQGRLLSVVNTTQNTDHGLDVYAGNVDYMSYKDDVSTSAGLLFRMGDFIGFPSFEAYTDQTFFMGHYHYPLLQRSGVMRISGSTTEQKLHRGKWNLGTSYLPTLSVFGSGSSITDIVAESGPVFSTFENTSNPHRTSERILFQISNNTGITQLETYDDDSMRIGTYIDPFLTKDGNVRISGSALEQKIHQQHWNLGTLSPPALSVYGSGSNVFNIKGLSGPHIYSRDTLASSRANRSWSDSESYFSIGDLVGYQALEIYEDKTLRYNLKSLKMSREGHMILSASAQEAEKLNEPHWTLGSKTIPALSVYSSGSNITNTVGSSGPIISTAEPNTGRIHRAYTSHTYDIPSIFSVSNGVGFPVVEAFEDNTIRLGTYNNPILDRNGIARISGSISSAKNYPGPWATGTKDISTLTVIGSGSLFEVTSDRVPMLSIEDRAGSYRTNTAYTSSTDALFSVTNVVGIDVFKVMADGTIDLSNYGKTGGLKNFSVSHPDLDNYENDYFDGESRGEIIYFGAGSVTKSECYVLSGSNKTWVQAITTEATTAGNLLGVANDTGTAATVGMMIRGMVRVANSELNGTSESGFPVYVSTTAGQFDFTSPTTSGDVVRAVGYCIDTTDDDILLYFDPDNTSVTIS